MSRLHLLTPEMVMGMVTAAIMVIVRKEIQVTKVISSQISVKIMANLITSIVTSAITWQGNTLSDMV
ncbi:putative membrane protein [Shigella flexneri 1235-66]|nr:putative membrane protein [Shigella flexneri 1235-66]